MRTVKTGFWQVYLVLITGVLFGCGDEAGNEPPSVLAASTQALCRADGENLVLDVVDIAVLDFDGAVDVGEGSARVLSTLIELERSEATYEPPLDEAGQPTGQSCGLPEAQCVARYRWQRGNDDPQIFCDEDDMPIVEFSVSDTAGHVLDIVILAKTEG